MMNRAIIDGMKSVYHKRIKVLEESISYWEKGQFNHLNILFENVRDDTACLTFLSNLNMKMNEDCWIDKARLVCTCTARILAKENKSQIGIVNKVLSSYLDEIGNVLLGASMMKYNLEQLIKIESLILDLRILFKKAKKQKYSKSIIQKLKHIFESLENVA